MTLILLESFRKHQTNASTFHPSSYSNNCGRQLGYHLLDVSALSTVTHERMMHNFQYNSYIENN